MITTFSVSRFVERALKTTPDRVIILSVTLCEGGVINRVYRAVTNCGTFYVKCTTASEDMRLARIPRDYRLLMGSTRLTHEVKALTLCRSVAPPGTVPQVVSFDARRGLCLLTDIGGQSAESLEHVFPERMTEAISERLAEFAATLANRNNRKGNCIRRASAERAARRIKIKYAYLQPCLQLFRNASARREIAAFACQSTETCKALSHGDYHPKNIVLRADDSIGVMDFEEAMIHDPVYDIGVLAASYIIWSIRRREYASRLLAAGDILIRCFLTVFKTREPRTLLYYRINNYIAGILMLRLVGISRNRELETRDARQTVRHVARRFVLSRMCTVDLINGIVL